MLDKKIINNSIIVISIIVFLSSIYFFFLGIRYQETGNFPGIGEVFKKDNSIRRKIDGNLSWNEIEHSSKIFPGDKIFTGSSSVAQLNLLDLLEVGMTPSTLVRIDPKVQEGIGLQGGLGLFTAKLSGKLNKSSIRLKNTTFELNEKGSEIQVNGTEEKTMVTALSGNITYHSNNEGDQKTVQTLKPNQLLGVNRLGIITTVALPTKLIVPINSEIKKIPSKTPVHFKWENLINNIPLSIELSKTPSL